MLVDGEVADANKGVSFVVLKLGGDCVMVVGALADAAGSGVTPIEGLEGAHFFAGIEDDILASGVEDHEVSSSWSKLRNAVSKMLLSRSTTFMAFAVRPAARSMAR